MPKAAEIDLATLPTVAFDTRGPLPKVSAVYFALSALGEVLYVGRTKDLHHRWRWKTHHRLRRLATLGCSSLAYLLCPTHALAETEQAMIQQFQPPLNGQKFSRLHQREKTVTPSLRQTSTVARHFALRIPEELWQALLEKAAREKRSINAQILMALEQDLMPSPPPGTRHRARRPVKR